MNADTNNKIKGNTLGSDPPLYTQLRKTPARPLMRLESPIQVFWRYVARDVEIDGVTLPARSRALMMYGSANRGERKWEAPESFEVRRKAAEELAFGYGPHQCVGLPLARLEMRAIFKAIAAQVNRFEVLESRWVLINTLQGLERWIVRAQ